MKTEVRSIETQLVTNIACFLKTHELFNRVIHVASALLPTLHETIIVNIIVEHFVSIVNQM